MIKLKRFSTKSFSDTIYKVSEYLIDDDEDRDDDDSSTVRVTTERISVGEYNELIKKLKRNSRDFIDKSDDSCNGIIFFDNKDDAHEYANLRRRYDYLVQEDCSSQACKDNEKAQSRLEQKSLINPI